MFTWTEANSWETGGYNAEQPSEMCFQIPPPQKKKLDEINVVHATEILNGRSIWWDPVLSGKNR